VRISDCSHQAFSIFSTAPQSVDFTRAEYSGALRRVADWSEAAGCKGTLIYSDNSLIDAWTAAQIMMAATTRLCPLVAVQPVYMHPYSAAKMVTSLSYLYGRKMCLNLIAGGFRNDLLSLCDECEHDQRYERLKEYTSIVKWLLYDQGPVTFAGRFYNVKNLVMRPALPRDLFPDIFVSGSSEAGMAAARALDAISVHYPSPGGDYPEHRSGGGSGIRIGIIAADESDAAWKSAMRRFPGDRSGQIRHLVAMKASDSHWHKKLSQIDRQTGDASGIYWLWPFKNYKTFCPYLVGSYDEVSDELVKYMCAGFDNYILDIPVEQSDLEQAVSCFRKAAEKFGNRTSRLCNLGDQALV
jgi:alkanesulfonate monooxygenase